MRFWFGLEILRLVYKKRFFNIELFSILFDLFFFEILCKGYQKKRNFALISKKVHNLLQEVPIYLKQEVCTVLNQRQIALLLIPFAGNFNDFFQLL